MSVQDAPLYVRAHDLARDLHARTPGWTGHPGLAEAVCAEGRALLWAVSLALAFPDERPGHQQAADHALLRLRTSLRLAEDLGLLGEGAARAVHGELTDLGRMLGGWRKRETDRQAARASATLRGGGPSPPPGG